MRRMSASRRRRYGIVTPDNHLRPWNRAALALDILVIVICLAALAYGVLAGLGIHI